MRIFPRRRGPDPVQSFPQISRRGRRRPLRQAPTRHALLLDSAAPPLFSRRTSASGWMLSLNRGIVVDSLGSRQPRRCWNVARLDSSPLQRPRRARFDSPSSRCFGRARSRAARGQDAPVRRCAVATRGRAANGSQQRVSRVPPEYSTLQADTDEGPAETAPRANFADRLSFTARDPTPMSKSSLRPRTERESLVRNLVPGFPCTFRTGVKKLAGADPTFELDVGPPASVRRSTLRGANNSDYSLLLGIPTWLHTS